MFRNAFKTHTISLTHLYTLSARKRPAARKSGVSESTVREIIKKYKEIKFENEELRELPRKTLSAKTLLPSELDDKVLQLIKNMRQARCVVNYNIAIATCKRVVLAKLIFQRTDFTTRQAATSKQPVPPCFLKEMGFSFHWAIKEVVDAYDISDDLLINIDQTTLPFVLLSK